MRSPPIAPVESEEVHGVAWLSEYLRDKMQRDPALRSIAIRGEVSNHKVSGYGHLNFALSEGPAVLQCFAWEDDFRAFPEFKNGSKIVALGSISTLNTQSMSLAKHYSSASTMKVMLIHIRALKKTIIRTSGAPFESRFIQPK